MTGYSERLPQIKESRKAIIRAARSAAKTAEFHNRPLILWQDGKVVRVPVDELPPLPEEAPKQINLNGSDMPK